MSNETKFSVTSLDDCMRGGGDILCGDFVSVGCRTDIQDYRDGEA